MEQQKFTETQQHQEDDYSIPAHWVLDRTTTRGRLYFGYLDICLEEVKKHPGFPNIKVCDAGCGDGRFLKELIDAGVQEVSGVDYSLRATAMARALVPEAKIYSEPLETLSIPDQYFDVVTCIETLEHIIPEQLPHAIEQIARKIKPDGKFVVTVPSDFLPPGPKHYQHFSPQKLADYLKASFDEVEISGQDKTSFHLLKLFYFLIDNKYWYIKPLTRWYNTQVWAKYFNRATYPEARRLVAISRKPKNVL